MAFLDQAINASDLPQSSMSYEPLPAGWYDARITDAELCVTKAQNGQYIKVRYDITGPAHQGRVVFGNLNIKNPSQKAEEIGRQQLGELMAAIGLASVRDTDELIGGELSIKLAIRRSEEYGDSNDIKGYKSRSGGAPVAAAPKPAAPAAASSAPWKK